MYKYDNRVVMTLDAGGTNLVFTAICGNEQILTPVVYPSCPNDLDGCLKTLADGFGEVRKKMSIPPVAISFAFPGPADYKNGVIGDLPNFPAFRGGVALGRYLENIFGIPVFINNDGNLFAYGEALAGFMGAVNDDLKRAGSSRRYNNLLGITLGTGFGAGVVSDGQLTLGDNGCAGDVWCFRNKLDDGLIAEESVSIRAVKHYFAQFSGVDAPNITPYDIYQIASGVQIGDRSAAVRAFAVFGQIAGDVIAQAATIVDGLIVIGGGLSGAAEYFMPALIGEMNVKFGMRSGAIFPRMQVGVYNYDDKEQKAQFLKNRSAQVRVPGTENEFVTYNASKDIAIAISKLGASRAIALGAYAYALTQLDKPKK